MTFLELVLFLVLGGAAAATVRAIPGVTKSWFLMAGLLGFLGAMLGTAIAHLSDLQGLLALDIAGQRLPILWSIGGAVLLTVWAIAIQVLVSNEAPA